MRAEEFMQSALMSLYDKEGCEKLAKKLLKYRRILATDGTYRYLKNFGINATKLSEITGIEESRELKTLSSNVYRMLFSGEIDIVVVNLYPFEANPCIENIDIGGVTLLRAAAKNFRKVLVICSKSQYGEVIEKFPDIDDLKLKYACKAFKLVEKYDRSIANWICNLNSKGV